MPHLTIDKQRDGSSLVVSLEGSLDTTSSPDLAADLKDSLDGVDDLVLDFTKLEYISSAGLRVVRGASKTMDGVGTMVVRGCNDNVREVFDITGFSDVITIE